jgi:hypothetical protein
MEKQDSPTQHPEAPEKERGPAQSKAPRGNPETDEQSVQKGREQLDKVSGN